MRLKKCLATPLLVAIAILATLLIVAPVLATVYSAPFTITESSGTAYSMLPVSTNSSNLWMAANGFMKVTALDTRVKTLGGLEKPHMVTDNRTFTVVPVPANSQTNLYYSMGNSDLVSMKIIAGYGGYFTVPHTSLSALSNNFSISWSGWFSASQAVDYVNKPSAISIVGDGSGNLTANIWTASLSASANISPNGAGANTTITDANPAVAHYLNVDDPVGSADNATTVVSTTSTSYVEDIYNLTSPTFLGTSQNITAVTVYWDTDVAGNEFGSAPILLLDGIKVYGTPISDINWNTFSEAFSRPGGGTWTASDFTNLQAGLEIKSASGAWQHSCTQIYVKIDYTYPLSVSASGLADSEKSCNVYADGTNFKLDVDGVNVASTPLGGISVTNNTNNWTFTAPYFNSVNITKGGNLLAWFQPNTMIIGTNLPDRQTGDGVANNGTFVWGTNPAGVAVSLASLVSESQPSPGETEEDVTRDILPVAGSSDWFGEPDVSGALLTNPLRPFVIIMSDTTSLTERQAWTWLGLAFVLFVLVISARSVRGHHVITGVATAAAMGACIAMTIFPIWALVFVIAAIGLGAVAERSPSL